MIRYEIVETETQLKLFLIMYKEYLEYLASIGHDIVTNPKLPDIEQELKSRDMAQDRQIIAHFDDELAGCIGLEKMDDDVCEMKRMFVKPEYRGKGMGKQLAELIVEEGKKMGYKYMRLSTLTYLKEALNIYRSLGFKEIGPYYEDDANIEDIVFLEIEL